MKVIQGKTAFVTGAASGIGKAIALELAHQGANLILLDRDADTLSTASEECKQAGVDVRCHICDLADTKQIDDCLEKIRSDDRPPSILINNAGVLYYNHFDTMSTQQWDTLMAVNLNAPFRMIHGLLPQLATQPEAHIVNIASVLGLIPKRKSTAYCTSKHAIVGMSLALRTELSPAIGVSVICPGLISTNLFDSATITGMTSTKGIRQNRLYASPELVAKHTLAAIRKNKRLVVVTAHAKIGRLAYTGFAGILDGMQMRRNKKRQSAAPSTSK